jgi:hypothetical protein
MIEMMDFVKQQLAYVTKFGRLVVRLAAECGCLICGLVENDARTASDGIIKIDAILLFDTPLPAFPFAMNFRNERLKPIVFRHGRDILGYFLKYPNADLKFLVCKRHQLSFIESGMRRIRTFTLVLQIQCASVTPSPQFAKLRLDKIHMMKQDLERTDNINSISDHCIDPAILSGLFRYLRLNRIHMMKQDLETIAI